MIARLACVEAASHFNESAYIVANYHENGRAGSSRTTQFTGAGFFVDLLARTFGADRANAILPVISPLQGTDMNLDGRDGKCLRRG